VPKLLPKQHFDVRFVINHKYKQVHDNAPDWQGLSPLARKDDAKQKTSVRSGPRSLGEKSGPFLLPLQTDKYEYFLDNEVAPIRTQLGDAGVCAYEGFVVRDVVRRL
jgi:hypothetical protein